MKNISTSIVAFLLGVLLTLPVGATIINLEASIDGAQEVPPSGSTATGTAAMTLDDLTNLFSWDITWSGLTGPAVAAHFHGPAPSGSNAGVQVNIGAISGLTSPSIGSTVINPTQAGQLLGDLWYINIHTAQFPGGEIRGQVTAPEPATILIFLMGLVGLGALRLRKG